MKLINVFPLLSTRVCNLLRLDSFKLRHRMHEKDFTRKRKLGFVELCILIINCSKRSIYVGLNEFMKEFKQISSYTSSAFCQAREKISHEAFKELFELVGCDFYKEANYKLFQKYRIWAIDGSDINLPNTEKTLEEFGSQSFKHGTQVQALVSFLYDVLNHVSIHAIMARHDANERALALEHLSALTALRENIGNDCPKEIILMDRGYPSEELIKTLQSSGFYFVIRSNKKGFWKEIRDAKNNDTVIHRKTRSGEQLTLRVIEVILEHGKSYTLLTNIIDNDFTISTFSDLYHMRWKQEIHYDTLKNALQLENFTGISPLFIRQDFYSIFLLSNLLACVEADCASEIEEINQTHQYKYQYKMNITRTLSHLKASVIALLVTASPAKAKKILKYIQSEFKKTLVPVRPGRSFPRKVAHPALKFPQNQKSI